MTLPLPISLALRYLRPRRTFVSVITVISVLGVTLGVMVLILVLSVMTGFDRAGSLCHAWSALPLYHHQACVLGVRPLTPGFERFLIAPYTDNLFEVSGSIPTPRGTLRIKWNRTSEGLEVTADGPDSLKPILGILTKCAVRRAVYNGKPIPQPSHNF